MHLLDDLRAAGGTRVIEFHDVKAARRLHDLADITGLHAGDDVGQKGRQLGALAPAERAAVERGFTGRIGDRELAEVLAAAGALVDVLRTFADLCELRRGRILRHGDQDVRHVVLVGRRGGFPLVLEVLIELVRRDRDALNHIARAQNLARRFRV